jgi:putative Ca2+/H+ antiporter (TMEM165/GDT1 family)
MARTREPPRTDPNIEAFLVSIAAVATSEIGDKTQLLALMLAARFRRPLPVIAGIAVATLANHTLAALVGTWLRDLVPQTYLRWLLAASFIAVAAWALVPDRQEEVADVPRSHFGIFAITAGAFFMAEMGDKTQIATLVLAAQFGSLVPVIAGTTLGMLIADVPVVFLGQVAASRIPMRAVRIVAAILFLALAAFALMSGG